MSRSRKLWADERILDFNHQGPFLVGPDPGVLMQMMDAAAMPIEVTYCEDVPSNFTKLVASSDDKNFDWTEVSAESMAKRLKSKKAADDSRD